MALQALNIRFVLIPLHLLRMQFKIYHLSCIHYVIYMTIVFDGAETIIVRDGAKPAPRGLAQQRILHTHWVRKSRNSMLAIIF